MFINDGRARSAAAGRTAEVSRRRVAQDPRDHQRLGLTAEELLAVPTQPSQQRRSAEPWHASKHAVCARAFGRTIALDGIDLRVEEGRILGLIGPNGAGKTTALNAILGLIPIRAN